MAATPSPAAKAGGGDWLDKAVAKEAEEAADDALAGFKLSHTDPEFESISAYLDGCKVLCVLPSKVAVEQLGSRDFKMTHFGLGAGAAEAIGAQVFGGRGRLRRSLGVLTG